MGAYLRYCTYLREWNGGCSDDSGDGDDGDDGDGGLLKEIDIQLRVGMHCTYLPTCLVTTFRARKM